MKKSNPYTIYLYTSNAEKDKSLLWSGSNEEDAIKAFYEIIAKNSVDVRVELLKHAEMHTRWGKLL